MTVLRFGLTPKMKPVSPKRAAVVAGIDIGTSKIVCMIARLEPQAPPDRLRRRSHGVPAVGFAHPAPGGPQPGPVCPPARAGQRVATALAAPCRIGANIVTSGASIGVVSSQAAFATTDDY